MKKIFLIVVLFSFTVLNAQSAFNVGVGGGYTLGNSAFHNVFNNGASGMLSLSYSLTENIQISATSGYQDFSYNNDYFDRMLNLAGFTSTAHTNTRLSVIPVMLGIKWMPVHYLSLRPYIQAEGGLHFLSAEAATVKVDGEDIKALDETSVTRGAWSAGVGCLYELTEGFNLDLSVKVGGNNEEYSTYSYDRFNGKYVKNSAKGLFMTFLAGFVVDL